MRQLRKIIGKTRTSTLGRFAKEDGCSTVTLLKSVVENYLNERHDADQLAAWERDYVEPTEATVA